MNEPYTIQAHSSMLALHDRSLPRVSPAPSTANPPAPIGANPFARFPNCSTGIASMWSTEFDPLAGCWRNKSYGFFSFSCPSLHLLLLHHKSTKHFRLSSFFLVKQQVVDVIHVIVCTVRAIIYRSVSSTAAIEKKIHHFLFVASWPCLSCVDPLAIFLTIW